MTHLKLVKDLVEHVNQVKQNNILLNGSSMTIGDVKALASDPAVQCYYPTDAEFVELVEGSRGVLVEFLENNKSIYGVTTGFGGNADQHVRNKMYEKLQLALIHHLNIGVMDSVIPEGIVRATMVQYVLFLTL